MKFTSVRSQNNGSLYIGRFFQIVSVVQKISIRVEWKQSLYIFVNLSAVTHFSSCFKHLIYNFVFDYSTHSFKICSTNLTIQVLTTQSSFAHPTHSFKFCHPTYSLIFLPTHSSFVHTTNLLKFYPPNRAIQVLPTQPGHSSFAHPTHRLIFCSSNPLLKVLPSNPPIQVFPPNTLFHAHPAFIYALIQVLHTHSSFIHPFKYCSPNPPVQVSHTHTRFMHPFTCCPSNPPIKFCPPTHSFMFCPPNLNIHVLLNQPTNSSFAH